MDNEQEGFLDSHVRERLSREMDIIEREKRKHQKKKEEKDWLAILSKGETYGHDTGRFGTEVSEK